MGTLPYDASCLHLSCLWKYTLIVRERLGGSWNYFFVLFQDLVVEFCVVVEDLGKEVVGHYSLVPEGWVVEFRLVFFVD